jgi:predicted O-methyltransferase YrrM
VSEELDALAAENRNLRRERNALRSQIEAFERSRWWRLHPRFVLRRRKGETDSAAATPVEPVVDDRRADRDAAAELVRRFRDEVISRGSFTEDWFTQHLPTLDPLVAPLAARPARILEIGSFEGMSACYFLWRLPDAQVTCIDTFLFSLEHEASQIDDGLEERFDRNIALVDATRGGKLVGDSRRLLLDLVEEHTQFDLVYVDGSHLALDVVIDAALAWRLLRLGGTLVFDDYMWNDVGEDRLLRPAPAVDALLTIVAGKYELLVESAQLALRKTA